MVNCTLNAYTVLFAVFSKGYKISRLNFAHLFAVPIYAINTPMGFDYL